MKLLAFVSLVLAHWPMGGLEIVLILAVVLILFGAKKFPELFLGLQRGIDEFRKATRDVQEELHRSLGLEDWQQPGVHEPTPPMRNRIILLVAQGFGAGRIPFAPGTFGTLPGLLWFLALLLVGNFWLFLAGILVGIALSVWLCGEAEKILQQNDPPSVVLDEITAMPVCFVPWVLSAWLHTGQMPEPASFFTGQTWWITAVLFALFRAFDILKPPPIRQSQRLPGGWGVTIDDVLAAVCVALLSLLVIS